jgi:hypothetical protein
MATIAPISTKCNDHLSSQLIEHEKDSTLKIPVLD